MKDTGSFFDKTSGVRFLIQWPSARTQTSSLFTTN